MQNNRLIVALGFLTLSGLALAGGGDDVVAFRARLTDLEGQFADLRDAVAHAGGGGGRPGSPARGGGDDTPKSPVHRESLPSPVLGGGGGEKPAPAPAPAKPTVPAGWQFKAPGRPATFVVSEIYPTRQVTDVRTGKTLTAEAWNAGTGARIPCYCGLEQNGENFELVLFAPAIRDTGFNLAVGFFADNQEFSFPVDRALGVSFKQEGTTKTVPRTVAAKGHEFADAPIDQLTLALKAAVSSVAKVKVLETAAQAGGLLGQVLDRLPNSHAYDEMVALYNLIKPISGQITDQGTTQKITMFLFNLKQRYETMLKQGSGAGAATSDDLIIVLPETGQAIPYQRHVLATTARLSEVQLHQVRPGAAAVAGGKNADEQQARDEEDLAGWITARRQDLEDAECGDLHEVFMNVIHAAGKERWLYTENLHNARLIRGALRVLGQLFERQLSCLPDEASPTAEQETDLRGLSDLMKRLQGAGRRDDANFSKAMARDVLFARLLLEYAQQQKLGEKSRQGNDDAHALLQSIINWVADLSGFPR